MQSVEISESLFEGAVSIEQVDGGWKPWRLPHTQLALFPSPDDALIERAENCSGVRLRFETDSTKVRLEVAVGSAVNPVTGRNAYVFDATVEGDVVGSVSVKPGDTDVSFDDLPGGTKTVEVWLPQDSLVVLKSLAIDQGASFAINDDPRPKWVTYGSSLTHCVRASSPALTWPAIVARKYGLNVTALGFGGQCCLDPVLGMVIRDLPADFITLKLGINCIAAAHLSARTYPANALGLVRIIREAHPDTPMVLISPIGHPPTESTPNAVNYTIADMRRDLKDVRERLVSAGDGNLYYADGLDVFSVTEIEEWTTDQCHPEANGMALMAENFDRAVMQTHWEGARSGD